MLRKDLKVGDVFLGTGEGNYFRGETWEVIPEGGQTAYNKAGGKHLTTSGVGQSPNAIVVLVSGPSMAQANLPKPDMVNAPSHYTRLSPEPMQVIEAWELDFQLGSALKYLARAGHKGGPEDEVLDLKKSVSFINRRIQRLEAKLKK